MLLLLCYFIYFFSLFFFFNELLLCSVNLVAVLIRVTPSYSLLLSAHLENEEHFKMLLEEQSQVILQLNTSIFEKVVKVIRFIYYMKASAIL